MVEDSAKEKISLEHVKHLRTINFALIALSVGAIILAIATGEPLADKALRELQSISSFIQSQESSVPFGSVWLRRRLLSEYGSLKFDPKQPQGGSVRSMSGQELDCFGFFYLGYPGTFLNPTSLNSLNATLLESTLSGSEPVKTIAQWKGLWDGLHASNGQIYWAQEIVFDRAEILVVDHRPEYKRSAQGTVGFGSLLEVVRGARPRKDLKWVWGPCHRQIGMIKTQFIFLRPSANHARQEYSHAFWLLLFKDPDVPGPRTWLGDAPWNMDAFYFLHIPVRVEKFSLDLQALIAREANSNWLPGTFSQSFTGLNQTLGDASEIPFVQAEKILRNFAELEARSSRRLSFGGVELAGAPIFPATLILLMACQTTS